VCNHVNKIQALYKVEGTAEQVEKTLRFYPLLMELLANESNIGLLISALENHR
jgi:cell fate (sporulation/competence/biofilm development) regulator YmcA (YheA/YmcA/DUF963 family)